MWCQKQFNLFLLLVAAASAFAPHASPARTPSSSSLLQQQHALFLLRSRQPAQRKLRLSSTDDAEADPMEQAALALQDDDDDDELANVDAATREQILKSRRADELRAQEVFMQKSTGKHRCTNCDWEYDETLGDSKMIGGTVAPGTAFADLPANWRCPVCRASKDSFTEVVEEIPGFEVNQGYGFGTNSWTSGQKNLAVFGGLGAFFLLFLSGYAMN